VTAALPGGSQDFALTLTHLFGRARTVHRRAEVVSLLDAEGTTRRATMAEVGAGADRLAAALGGLGIGEGDRVASFAWNGQQHLEAYWAVPCVGAVLHTTLNPRLSPEQVAFTIDHAGDRVVLVDAALVGEMERALPHLRAGTVERFVVIGHGDAGALPGALRYEELLDAEEQGFEWPALDERAAAALCYTARRSARRSCASTSSPASPNGGCRRSSPTWRRSRRRASASSTRGRCARCSPPTGCRSAVRPERRGEERDG
jgi:fatty-acyl-CoA synthase